MFGRFLAAALLCLVPSIVAARTVLWDEGGLINERGREVHELIGREEPVRIIGICLSSCTMYLAVPGVCVHRDAVLMFHGPYSFSGPISREHYLAGVDWMAKYYPPPLDDWFREVGHTGQYWMKGSSLFPYGVTECK